MPDWKSLLISVLVVAVLTLLLRWAFGGHGRSLVQRRPRPGGEDDYGLLVSIASPGTFIDGEVARRRLEEAGIRASLVLTDDGPRLMVFRSDEVEARRLLAR